ncbi:hypothetical protein BD779DRAFT_1568898, partial [Infundibulicybe gibba]
MMVCKLLQPPPPSLRANIAVTCPACARTSHSKPQSPTYPLTNKLPSPAATCLPASSNT